MAMGCPTCHSITTKGDKTTITLMAPAPQLCATCHNPIDAPVKHEPYEKGQCLDCHNPHSSNYIAHTRAPTKKLCLGCHGIRKAAGVSLPLFDGKTVPVAEYDAAPKVELDPSGRVGHPFMGHPVTGYPDPFHKGQPFSCVSCHSPHATAMEHLLSDRWKSVKVCEECHQAAKAAKKPKPAAPQKSGESQP